MLETLTKANDRLEELIDNIDMNHPNLDEGILIIGNEISPVFNHIKKMAPDDALMEINSIGLGPEIRRAELLMIQTRGIIDNFMEPSIILKELKKANDLLEEAINKTDAEDRDWNLPNAVVIYYLQPIIERFDDVDVGENERELYLAEVNRASRLLNQLLEHNLFNAGLIGEGL